jgi:gliding motility-associated-like protein
MKLIFTLFLAFIANTFYGQTFTNSTGGAIPDDGLTPTCYPLTVTGVGNINSTTGLKSVCLKITHPLASDLSIFLKAPDGSVIFLSFENGGSGSNYTNTCFTMSAATPIFLGNAPFTGNFLPEENLGWFNNNINANGVWNLCIQDSYAGDVGTLNNWSLTFGSSPAPFPVAGCGTNAAASHFCQSAPGICNLNGYCGNTSASYDPPYIWPELVTAFANCTSPSPSIENNSFIKFVASASAASFNVSVTNSQNGDGIQFLVFSGGCGSGPVTTYGCSSPMAPGTNLFNAAGLTPGVTYYLMIDGFAGDVCDYTITAISGVNILNVTPAAPVLCVGGPGVTLTASGGNGTYTWSPATNLSATTGATVTASPAGTITYTVTSGSVGSLSCPLTKNVTVTVSPRPTVTSPSIVCIGNTGTLTPTTGGNWTSSNTAIATVTNAGVITGVSLGNVTFTFTSSSTTCSNTTASVAVNAATVPTFNPIATLCFGGIRPVLVNISTNGITGTWNPAIVNNTASGTYTFTPNAGQCATTTTLSITVTPPIVPTFPSIPAFCSGSTTPLLPTTSTNSITGTWNPATVNNTTTANYTFTPGSAQCASPVTITVTVNPPLSPAITCGVATNSSVTFNWTNVAGATNYAVTYTINGGAVVNAGNISTNTLTVSGLANNASVVITIVPSGTGCLTSGTATCVSLNCSSPITPSFNSIPAICSGSGAPVLPTTSINGIPGTWNPATVSNTTTGTYTFTPATGQCATTATLTVTINPLTLPTFATIPAICSGATAPILPTTSINGIPGSWNPATVSNTTTGTYTFTPANSQCATSTTLIVTVNPNITPSFSSIAAICNGAVAPILPTTSLNGITGTWNPAIVSNTTSGTYTFTPTAGLCAVTTTLSVTVNPIIAPTFASIPAFCSGATAPILPATSTNGIAGTWNPTTVSNTTSATYSFTPNAGQCASPITISVTVTPNNSPTITCGVPTLTSVIFNWNNILGATGYNVTYTINGGAVINAGTLNTNTFTLNGLGANNSVNITILPVGTGCFTSSNATCVSLACSSPVTTTFANIPAFCSGTTAPILPTTSTNGITGTWTPATVSNTTTGNYTFVPSTGQCATSPTITITVNPIITPTFATIPAICSGTTAPILPVTSTNGITGTWNPATVSNITSGTYNFTPSSGTCVVPITVTITVNPNITPSFATIAPICSGAVAPILPTTSINGITGTWNPATVSNTTTGTYIFTPTAGLCATTTSLTVTVNPIITPTFTQIPAFCAGPIITPTLPTTSLNGITGTWNPSSISNTASGTYIFTPTAGLCATTTSMVVTVNPILTPTFAIITSICSGATAPILPTTSTNGIIGTWNPATVNNTTTGTYTFTPSSGTCVVPITVTITVNPNITPGFSTIAPICSGATAPVLATTSSNGITGTWNPATVSNTTTGTYIFTPTAGLCATTASLTVIVNPIITPSFATIAPICSGATAPILPTTSTNGITGTWNPSSISNTASGTYIFTPTAGLCATSTSMVVTVNPIITPTFATIPAICSGATAPILPTTSTNGISGTWNPTTVNNSTTGTYTFTPSSGTCVVPISVTITVNPNITPSFSTIAPICNGATAPILPTTSTNSITGTWNPSIVSNTTTGNYVFTPTVGQCATTKTITITVNPIITPTFNAISAICNGATAPILQTTSNNGITGIWSPATVSNTATGNYTFTPNAGQCATSPTITVTVNPIITPTFATIPAICSGATAPILPTTSTNGISGTWNPATVDNTTTGTYTFTPTSGTCVVPTNITITVNPILTPTFNAIGPYCAGSTPPSLPTTSSNGITGTWNPAVVNTTVTSNYTFTSNAGQCASSTIKTIIINPLVTPTFTAVVPFCESTVAPSLPSTSVNGISGTWLPSIINNTTSGIYTFTPTTGQCATTAILPVVIIPKPVINLGVNRNICENASTVLNATNSSPIATYLWQDTSSSPTFTVTQAGTYSVNVNNGLCSATKSVVIGIDSLPKFSLVGKNTICPGETIILKAVSIQTNNNYLWQNGSTNPSISVNTQGLYFVNGTNNCGTARKSISIINGICSLYMPNAFTPNADGKNDVFKPGGEGAVSNFAMEIYNRWGQKIYLTYNIYKGWDGTYETKDQPTGNYVYQVSYKENSTGKDVKLSGSFLLIR